MIWRNMKWYELSIVNVMKQARRLKKVINTIRSEVLKDLHSESMRERFIFHYYILLFRQLATAIWIIDKLALRVGNEKSEVFLDC